MSQNDTLAVFFPQNNEPPSSSYMVPSFVGDIIALAADDTNDEESIFRSVLPYAYTGGGVNVDIVYAMASATSGKVRFDGKFARASSGTNNASLSWSTAVSVNIASVPSSAGNHGYASIGFTDGAQISSIQLGDLYYFSLTRKSSDTTNDTATGDAYIFGAAISEA